MAIVESLTSGLRIYRGTYSDILKRIGLAKGATLQLMKNIY